MGIFPKLGMTAVALEGANDWRAPRGLHGNHPGPLLANEADRLQFGECLPHSNQSNPSAGRIQNRIGQLPIELLGKLEPHRLLALDAIGLFNSGSVEPSGLSAAGADQSDTVVRHHNELVHARTTFVRL